MLAGYEPKWSNKDFHSLYALFIYIPFVSSLTSCLPSLLHLLLLYYNVVILMLSMYCFLEVQSHDKSSPLYNDKNKCIRCRAPHLPILSQLMQMEPLHPTQRQSMGILPQISSAVLPREQNNNNIPFIRFVELNIILPWST